MAFRVHDPLGNWNDVISKLISTAHLFAHLRFNPGVTSRTAKLTTGWLSSRLGRAGFAPAGQLIRFHQLPPDPALPGRNHATTPRQ